MKFSYDGKHHVVTWLRGGFGPMAWVQPKCTCGWTGTREYAYTDEQISNAEQQSLEHEQEVKGN